MSFLVRFIHVGAVSFLLGGAVLIALLFLALKNLDYDAAREAVMLDLLKVYEWAFWAAVAVVVITGVGNLARFGEGLPEPGSEWGGDLTLKLFLASIVLMVSLVRTFSAVLLLAGEARSQMLPVSGTLPGLYWLTAVLLSCVLAAAVALAHF
jgi:uncharacterized membrane protein